MAGVNTWIENLVGRLGEAGIGFLLALETVLPPLPSELVLSFAGFQAALGRLNPVTAWTAATIGSLVGAWALYWLGAWVGRDRLQALAARRWFVILSPRDLARGERFFAAHGGTIVLVGRLVPLLRSAVSVPAGLERMPLVRFSMLTVVGSGIWNGALITAGWQLEDRFGALEGWVRPGALAVLGGLLVLFAVTAVRRIRERQGGFL